ncbi:MAG: SBBP repeat-containing protein [Ignavibacteriae bacterium]|nr:SBBP repeat-containing protein [Ignavibacteriota bacterium]
MSTRRIVFITMFLCVAAMVCRTPVAAQQRDSVHLRFATYLGGKTFEQARDITCDAQGNVYVTGGTSSRDFPTTPGAYDRTFATGGTSLGSGGPMDVFVTKFDRNGRLLWSTYVGGPNYDRAYAMEVDDSGYLYIAGRAGEGFPTTPGVLQPAFAGDTLPNGAYGKQDGFVAKLSPDGSRLVWSTYFGRQDGGICRDMHIDARGNVYLAQPGVLGPHPHVTAGAYQTRHAGGEDAVVAKLAPDASSVIWASYYGGSGADGGGPTVRVGPGGRVWMVGSTNSRNLPVTSTAFDTSYNGGSNDVFVVCFEADGSAIRYGAYLGGSATEGTETHNLAIDGDGNAFVTSGTNSADFPTTPGALQRTMRGTSDAYITKISSDGSTLLASTYLGGSSSDFTEGIRADAAGRVTVGGGTSSADFPVTADAAQKTLAGAGDAFAARFTPDLGRTEYATFFGGTLAEGARCTWSDDNGSLYIAGQTLSPALPLLRAAQPALADTAGREDAFVASYTVPDPVSDIHSTPAAAEWRMSIHPHPAYGVTRFVASAERQGGTAVLYTLAGLEAASFTLTPQDGGGAAAVFDVSHLPAGLYILRYGAIRAQPLLIVPSSR